MEALQYVLSQTVTSVEALMYIACTLLSLKIFPMVNITVLA